MYGAPATASLEVVKIIAAFMIVISAVHLRRSQHMQAYIDGREGGFSIEILLRLWMKIG